MSRTLKPELLERIRPLVQQGLSSTKIAAVVGIGDRAVRFYARHIRAEQTSPNGSGSDPTPPGPTLDDVPLRWIALEDDTQARERLNHAVIRDYAETLEEGAAFPRVVLFFNGDQCFWIGDGFHRIHAAQQVGFETIKAEVRQGGRRAAQLYAASANQTHGLRRTNADKHRAVLILLQDEEWRQWSDRAIARHCGVTQPFVSKLRHALSDNGYQMPETRQVRRGETVYEMDTGRVGRQETITAPTNGTQADDHQAEVMAPADLPAMAEMPSPAPEGRTSEGYGRQTVRDLYGQGVEIPPPPSERPYALEESLRDLHSRVLMYLQAVEQKGGIKLVTEGWTQERKQDFLRCVAEILAKWTVFAAHMQDAYPQALMIIRKGMEA